MRGCPYCDQLKQLLTQAGLDFIPVDIETHPKLFERMTEQSGAEHVPQVLVTEYNAETKSLHNGKYVSEYDTLEEAVEKTKTLLT